MAVTELETTITGLLQQAFEGAEHLAVELSGNHLNVTIAWPGFDSLSRIKRQQAVYAVLNDYIASGEVHAVNMSLHDSDQWSKAKHFM